jgi:mono/diheme cytochrome c family protein
MKRVCIWFWSPRRSAIAATGIVLSGIMWFGVAGALAQKERSSRNRPAFYAALAWAPEKARVRENPFEGDAQSVAAGGKLFEQHCAECHGRKAGGTRRGPSLLREEVQQATPGTLFWVVTNGVVRRGMPVWSKLPEPERWQLVTFLESLKVQSMPAGSMPGESVPAQPVAPVQHFPKARQHTRLLSSFLRESGLRRHHSWSGRSGPDVRH